MEEQESKQPVEDDEGFPQVDPEVEEQQLKHAREIFERIKDKPSVFPITYTFLEAMAEDETTKPTDIMGLAMLMDKYPGVTLGVGRTISKTEEMRKDQIASLRYHAEKTGKDIDEIYRRDRATVDEVLAKPPELLNPYEVSQTPQLKDKVGSIVGQEESGVFMKKIIPNVVFARRLWKIATERLSQQLPPEIEPKTNG